MLKVKVEHSNELSGDEAMVIYAIDQDKDFYANCAWDVKNLKHDIKAVAKVFQESMNYLIEHYNGKSFPGEKLNEEVQQ